MLEELYKFNNEHFQVPEYKYKLQQKEIDEWTYALKKEKLFLPIYPKLVDEFHIELKQKNSETFLDK